jgi:hypothetical protein
MQQLCDNNGAVVTFAALQAANPYTSFPAILKQTDVEPFGLNVVIPVGQPVPPNAYYTVTEGSPELVNGVWTQYWSVTPMPLASAQAAQIQLLSSACAQALVSGFTSSALGSAYIYPSGLIDQQNLSTAVISSMAPGLASTWTIPFWCSNSGAWALTPHTAAQIQQVGTDWQAAKSALQTQYATLIAQVQAATTTTVDAVAAIAWSFPSTGSQA